MSNLLHNVAETLKIVEAFAEHDFLRKRLSGMVCAAGCEAIIFCVYCQRI